jgi:hypothetical protein
MPKSTPSTVTLFSNLDLVAKCGEGSIDSSRSHAGGGP